MRFNPIKRYRGASNNKMQHVNDLQSTVVFLEEIFLKPGFFFSKLPKAKMSNEFVVLRNQLIIKIIFKMH